MYVNGLGVDKDIVKGYAWLKLATKDRTQKHIDLENQVYELLNVNQKTQANIEYKSIIHDYGSIAALTRRDRWVHKQKMKMTGTRTGSLVFAPINFDSPHGNGFYNSVQAYVDDYNYGYVTSGEIIPIENNKKETYNK
jgi:TPR repeat protein